MQLVMACNEVKWDPAMYCIPYASECLCYLFPASSFSHTGPPSTGVCISGPRQNSECMHEFVYLYICVSVHAVTVTVCTSLHDSVR